MKFEPYYDQCMEQWSVRDTETFVMYPCTSENMANEFTKLLNELHEENQKLKEDAKQVLFVLACCNRDFGLSVNEAKAIKRLNECVDGCYNINNIKEYLND
jgi:hypothetical protein